MKAVTLTKGATKETLFRVFRSRRFGIAVGFGLIFLIVSVYTRLFSNQALPKEYSFADLWSEEVANWLRQMDVGVAPYPEMEPFYFSPLKIYEYMAAALPVVASRVGGLDRVVREQKTGLLYPPGDAAGLQAALAGLRADPALCRRLGQAARDEAIEDRKSVV